MVYEIENESNKLVLLGCAVWWTDGKHAHLGYGGAHHRDRQIDRKKSMFKMSFNPWNPMIHAHKWSTMSRLKEMFKNVYQGMLPLKLEFHATPQGNFLWSSLS